MKNRVYRELSYREHSSFQPRKHGVGRKLKFNLPLGRPVPLFLEKYRRPCPVTPVSMIPKDIIDLGIEQKLAEVVC